MSVFSGEVGITKADKRLDMAGRQRQDDKAAKLGAKDKATRRQDHSQTRAVAAILGHRVMLTLHLSDVRATATTPRPLRWPPPFLIITPCAGLVCCFRDVPRDATSDNGSLSAPTTAAGGCRARGRRSSTGGETAGRRCCRWCRHVPKTRPGRASRRPRAMRERGAIHPRARGGFSVITFVPRHLHAQSGVRIFRPTTRSHHRLGLVARCGDLALSHTQKNMPFLLCVFSTYSQNTQMAPTNGAISVNIVLRQ